MNSRFRNLVYGLAFAIMVGFILRIGKPIFIPIISGIISVYVLSTVATSLGRVPIIGSWIPLWLRHFAALLVFIFLGFLLVVLFADNPNFRGAFYGTNKLFLNSIFFSTLFDQARLDEDH